MRPFSPPLQAILARLCRVFDPQPVPVL